MDLFGIVHGFTLSLLMKTKQGGYRYGSGRKQKYGEPTKPVTLRIPISMIEKVKQVVSKFLKSMTQ